MEPPYFSIIVPVLYEGETINDVIEHLNQLSSGTDVEIIIVDGALEKDTLKAIRKSGVIRISSQKGRATQMNAGASVARGEILIFLHADTELPVRAFDRIRTLMEQKGYVGGAFDLGIRSNRFILKVVSLFGSLRSRLNRVPYGDQAIFVRREFFNRIGGYKEIPLMEDVELMRRIKRSGERIWIFPERVMTSSRRWEEEGVVYCTLRNWTLASLFYLGVSPERLANFYRSKPQEKGM